MEKPPVRSISSLSEEDSYSFPTPTGTITVWTRKAEDLFVTTTQSRLLTLTYATPIDGTTKAYRERYFSDVGFIVRKLRKSCSDFALVPEFGERGNFHWHAWVRISDTIAFGKFLHRWRYSHGLTNVRRCFSPLATHIYLRKQNNIIWDALGLKKPPRRYRIITYRTAKSFLVYIGQDKRLRRAQAREESVIAPCLPEACVTSGSESSGITYSLSLIIK